MRATVLSAGLEDQLVADIDEHDEAFQLVIAVGAACRRHAETD